MADQNPRVNKRKIFRATRLIIIHFNTGVVSMSHLRYRHSRLNFEGEKEFRKVGTLSAIEKLSERSKYSAMHHSGPDPAHYVACEETRTLVRGFLHAKSDYALAGRQCYSRHRSHPANPTCPVPRSSLASPKIDRPQIARDGIIKDKTETARNLKINDENLG